MMKTNLRWQTDSQASMQPNRRNLDGKQKQYVGIGRIGMNVQSEDNKYLFKANDKFNVSEGRDYTLDAPATHDDEEDANESKKKNKEEVVIPVVKSPA